MWGRADIAGVPDGAGIAGVPDGAGIAGVPDGAGIAYAAGSAGTCSSSGRARAGSVRRYRTVGLLGCTSWPKWDAPPGSRAGKSAATRSWPCRRPKGAYLPMTLPGRPPVGDPAGRSPGHRPGASGGPAGRSPGHRHGASGGPAGRSPGHRHGASGGPRWPPGRPSGRSSGDPRWLLRPAIRPEQRRPPLATRPANRAATPAAAPLVGHRPPGQSSGDPRWPPDRPTAGASGDILGEAGRASPPGATGPRRTMTCDRSAAAHSRISLVWFHDRGDFRGEQHPKPSVIMEWRADG